MRRHPDRSGQAIRGDATAEAMQRSHSRGNVLKRGLSHHNIFSTNPARSRPGSGHAGLGVLLGDDISARLRPGEGGDGYSPDCSRPGSSLHSYLSAGHHRLLISPGGSGSDSAAGRDTLHR